MNRQRPAAPRREARQPRGLRAAIGRFGNSSVGRDTSQVALGQILFKGALYLASIALSRSLSVEQFAAFGYFIVTSRFLSIFFSAGLTVTATKAFADAAADKADAEKTAAVLVLMVAATLIAAAISPLYLPILSDETIALDGGWVVLGAAAQAAYLIAIAAMFGASAFRHLLPPLALGAAALMAGAAASATSGDIRPAMLGYVMLFLMPALLFGRRLLKSGALSLVRPSRGSLAGIARMAGPTLATAVITGGVAWLVSRVLVEHAVSTGEFNKFVIGLQWFVLVLFLPNALANALFPRFLHAAREGRLDVRVAAGVALSVFASIALLALAGWLFTPLLAELYQYQFSPEFVVAILAAAAIAGPVTMLSFPIIALFGAARWTLANLVLLAVTVGLLATVPPTTALDAALILCAGQAVVLLLAMLLLWRAPRAAGRRA